MYIASRAHHTGHTDGGIQCLSERFPRFLPPFACASCAPPRVIIQYPPTTTYKRTTPSSKSTSSSAQSCFPTPSWARGAVHRRRMQLRRVNYRFIHSLAREPRSRPSQSAVVSRWAVTARGLLLLLCASFAEISYIKKPKTAILNCN